MTFIAPMLLETAAEPFNNDNYIFEPKIDGQRLILSHTNGTTRLYTRHHNDCTLQYPEILSVPFTEEIILDGEVACTDESGAICFESVMERFSAKKATKISQLSEKRPVNYLVFDILRYKGVDLRSLPLEKRKEILAITELPANPHVVRLPYYENEGIALYSQIKARNMEGIVAKRKNSLYVSNRSDSWLKVINWTYLDVYITGIRKKEFGWQVSVLSESGRMKPAGIIELGVTPKQRMAFYSVKDALITTEDRAFVYLEPRLKACVKIRNWTRGGFLRSPTLVEFIV
jgi:DNA ligase-1